MKSLLGNIIETAVKAEVAHHAIDAVTTTVRSVAEINTKKQTPTVINVANECIHTVNSSSQAENHEEQTEEEAYYISGTCVACGAPIAGYAGEPVRCEYCDTLQTVESKYYNVKNVTRKETPKVKKPKTVADGPSVKFIYTSRDGTALNVSFNGAMEDITLTGGGNKTLSMSVGTYNLNFVMGKKAYSRVLNIYPNTKSVTVSVSHAMVNKIDIFNRQECSVTFTYVSTDQRVGLNVNNEQIGFNVNILNGCQHTTTLGTGNYVFNFQFNHRSYNRELQIDNKTTSITVDCSHGRHNEINITKQ